RRPGPGERRLDDPGAAPRRRGGGRPGRSAGPGGRGLRPCLVLAGAGRCRRLGDRPLTLRRDPHPGGKAVRGANVRRLTLSLAAAIALLLIAAVAVVTAGPSTDPDDPSSRNAGRGGSLALYTWLHDGLGIEAVHRLS